MTYTLRHNHLKPAGKPTLVDILVSYLNTLKYFRISHLYHHSSIPPPILLTSLLIYMLQPASDLFINTRESVHLFHRLLASVAQQAPQS